ncbi:hypothetical protein [Longimicrobium sp.]|uniref:hypothetical protein n=1 Tax=Longimicrobium sp. TaxID=2029185 RepID=UPI002E322746|nr:hypothetical protein [Longimicrobium sp.]HEX6037756.1 hypothetical protein [Longimicrobium sp.]
MVASLWKACAWALVGLGGVHTLLTVPFYGQLTPEAVWFAGTGLMMVLLGLLNLIGRRTADPGARRLCQAADMLGLLFGMLSVLAVPEPQAFVGLGLLFGLAIGALAPVPQDQRVRKDPR